MILSLYSDAPCPQFDAFKTKQKITILSDVRPISPIIWIRIHSLVERESLSPDWVSGLWTHLETLCFAFQSTQSPYANMNARVWSHLRSRWPPFHSFLVEFNFETMLQLWMHSVDNTPGAGGCSPLLAITWGCLRLLGVAWDWSELVGVARGY